MFGENILTVEAMFCLSPLLFLIPLAVAVAKDKMVNKYRKNRRRGKKVRKDIIMGEYRIDADYGFTEPEVGLLFTDKDFSHIFIVTEIDKDVVTVECMSKMSKEDFMSNYKWLCPRGSIELEKGNNLDRHFYT